MTAVVLPYAGEVVRTVEFGNDLRTLHYADGVIRFQHPCKMIDPNRQLVTAPYLQLGNGHTVVQEDPLTIVASVACGDCPIHGFITNGQWVPC